MSLPYRVNPTKLECRCSTPDGNQEGTWRTPTPSPGCICYPPTRRNGYYTSRITYPIWTGTFIFSLPLIAGYSSGACWDPTRPTALCPPTASGSWIQLVRSGTTFTKVVDPHWFNADLDPVPNPGNREKIYSCKFFFKMFGSKIAIYLSLGLHKGGTSYRRRLQLSKENIENFKTWKFLTFFYICVIFALLDPDPGTRINADPQPCFLPPCPVESLNKRIPTKKICLSWV